MVRHPTANRTKQVIPNQGDAERRGDLWGVSKGDAGLIRICERPFTVCPQISNASEESRIENSPAEHPHSSETGWGSATEIWPSYNRSCSAGVLAPCLS